MVCHNKQMHFYGPPLNWKKIYVAKFAWGKFNMLENEKWKMSPYTNSLEEYSFFGVNFLFIIKNSFIWNNIKDHVAIIHLQFLFKFSKVNYKYRKTKIQKIKKICLQFLKRTKQKIESLNQWRRVNVHCRIFLCVQSMKKPAIGKRCYSKCVQ